jgi:hypothetical protein
MRTRIDRLARSVPFFRRFVALPSTTLLLLTCSVQAGTVLQFAQVNAGNFVTATESGGVTTLSTANNPLPDGGPLSIIVSVTNFNGAPFPPIPVFETFVNVVSTDAATSSGGTITQHFAGEIDFTVGPGPAGGSNLAYLMATFTDAVFSGSTNSASLNISVPHLIFGSNMAPFGPDTGMSIAFTGIGPQLGMTDGSVASFTAQNAGTFSSTQGVPEPGTLCLASSAIVVGTLAYGRKRMKNER